MEMTSVSPLPSSTFQQGLLQAVLSVTKKLRESSIRYLSLPAGKSMHGLNLLKWPLPCFAAMWHGGEGSWASFLEAVTLSSSACPHHPLKEELSHIQWSNKRYYTPPQYWLGNVSRSLGRMERAWTKSISNLHTELTEVLNTSGSFKAATFSSHLKVWES